MDKEISYLNRTFSDYKEALVEYSKKYYPDLDIDYEDASVGSWMIDLNAEIGDNLSYHIDRVFQETNINSASETASIYSMARSAGFKIPGPKGSMAEVRFTCFIPIAVGDGVNGNRLPDWNYAPIIKRGTRVSSGIQSFELLSDVDFREQFDEHGNSDRTIVPIKNSNGIIIKYEVSKLAVVVAGESRIYKQSLSVYDIKPFMEILIPVENVMNVESIVVKDGNSLQTYPTYGEFYMLNEKSTTYPTTTRFFEVDYLAQQNRWAERTVEDNPVIYKYGYTNDSGTTTPVFSITRGEWKPIKHKFMTEYTDSGYLKVIFGAGVEAGNDIDMPQASDFARHQISKVIRNDSLGVLPKPNTTIFILYRVGGGASSNVARGAITDIPSLRIEVASCIPDASEIKKESVRASVRVSNTTPSVSGKDMPSPTELKYLMKYNIGAQERCVTVKDYIARILLLPPKYGTPFRVGAMEENNKVMLYLLGVDSERHLDATLPDALVQNIQDYLSEYRMINDFVEIKSGRIVNLSFEADIHVDRGYNKTDVVNSVKEKIIEYMDINAHNMGDDIYVGDIEKEISKIDGVVNLIDLRIYNEVGNGYSQTQTTQEIVSYDECSEAEQEEYNVSGRLKLDLKASDKVLYCDGDTMLEIKYPSDVTINAKEV